MQLRKREVHTLAPPNIDALVAADGVVLQSSPAALPVTSQLTPHIRR